MQDMCAKINALDLTNACQIFSNGNFRVC